MSDSEFRSVKKVYLLPGLGADQRMYRSQLKVLQNAEVLEHLSTIKGESLADYAKRFVPFFDTSSPFVLLGTSLGGMIAVELSQHIKPEKIILLASVKSRDEFPAFIRSMKYLRLHQLFRGRFYKNMNNLLAERLGNRGDAEASATIKAMMHDVHDEFIEWAINAVIYWNPPVNLRKDIIHIHGTADQLFPFSRVKNAIQVKGGSHVMNMTMSDAVNEILLREMSK